MLLIETSYPTPPIPQYSKTSETQENDYKTYIMKMIEILKDVMNKSLKEIDGKTNKMLKERNEYL